MAFDDVNFSSLNIGGGEEEDYEDEDESDTEEETRSIEDETVSGELGLSSNQVEVLWMVGCRPIADSLGRVNRVEAVSHEELGRPRINVVVNCSAVFRDLFINQLDRAMKMLAELDEPSEQNYVRKHALEQAETLGVNVREAATRNFSNAFGSYSPKLVRRSLDGLMMKTKITDFKLLISKYMVGTWKDL